MFTNNFRKLLFKYVFGARAIDSDSAPPSSYSSKPTLISISGSSCYFDANNSQSLQLIWKSAINSLSTLDTIPTNSRNSRGYILLGTGTTAPTADDYCLESQITENLSCDSVSVSRTTTTKTYTATFSNSGTSDMTVTEIGYALRMCYYIGSSSDTYTYDNFLMDRTVLETPITIPAGESRTVTYELSF